MSAGQWLTAVAAVALVLAVGGTLAALWFMVRVLVSLRETVEDLHDESRAIVAEMHAALADASAEVERVDDLLNAAAAVGDRVDAASRFAVRTVTGPVVRVLALGTGTRRAVERIRHGEEPTSDLRRRSPVGGRGRRGSAKRVRDASVSNDGRTRREA